MMFNKTIVLFGAGLLATVAAQTYSDCNPLKKTSCSPDTGLSSSTYSVDFTSGSDEDNWTSVGSGDVKYTSNGAEFTITEKGNAPTIETSWYIFFGRVEIHMKAASGTGIVSSALLLSDDLDEVDWEWLGGSPNQVQTNYFGKGNSTSDTRSTTVAVTASQTTSHNYTLHWTKASCIWYIDGTAIRTLTYADALNGENYPQTPMRVKLGIWAGGDSDNAEGTITWAGGETDYNDGPFTMTVESVKVENYNPAKSYTYSDQTGDDSSIKLDESDDTTTSSKTATKSTTSSRTSSTTTISTASSQKIGSSTSNSNASSSNASTTASSASVITSSAAAAGGIISPNAWLVGILCAMVLLRQF